MTTKPAPPTPAVARLLLDAGPYVSCEECFDRLDGFVERRLAGGAPEPDLESHLLGCPACAEDADSLTTLLEADAARGAGGRS